MKLGLLHTINSEIIILDNKYTHMCYIVQISHKIGGIL